MTRSVGRRWLVGMAAAALAAAARGDAPAHEEHVRGDVVSKSGDVLRVKARDGHTLSLRLAPDVHVTDVKRANVEELAKGDFVGTTAVPAGDGKLRAVEVHVFPPSMRGTGEGQRPWDLGAAPGGTMTNGTVAGVGPGPGQGSTMTNATVAEVQRGGTGETLALSFRNGQATVLVPPGTTVVRIEPGAASDLAPGVHVFAGVSRQPDGTRVARRVVVGKDVAPPM